MSVTIIVQQSGRVWLYWTLTEDGRVLDHGAEYTSNAAHAAAYNCLRGKEKSNVSE